MEPVRALRQRVDVTQAELGRRARTSQPTIAAYESGRKSPTLRTLERLASSVGFEVAVNYVPRLTREERRSLAVHQAIAAQLVRSPGEVMRRARRNLARLTSLHPHARPLLGEWRRVLRRPIEQIVDVLVDPRPFARELRHVTPFAGVLPSRDRVAVYRRFRDAERTAA